MVTKKKKACEWVNKIDSWTLEQRKKLRIDNITPRWHKEAQICQILPVVLSFWGPEHRSAALTKHHSSGSKHGSKTGLLPETLSCGFEATPPQDIATELREFSGCDLQ